MARRAVPVDSSIGERIKARRDMRDWSIRYAASRAGVAPSTWMRVEKGELRTDRYMIADFAAALECAVTDLTGQPHVPGDRQLETAHARVEGLWQALVEIAPDEPADRSAPPIEALRDRFDLLDARRLRCDYAVVGDLLPSLLRDLHAAADGRHGREAMVLLVDATNTARGMLRALVYLAEATFAAERCRQIAERLGEPVPLAVADWARSNAAAGGGSYRRSLTLASRAQDALQHHLGADDALAMAGMLHLSSALALLREQPHDAFAHLAEAADLADRTGETGSWWMSFGPTNVGIWRMGALVDAGEAGKAVELASALRPAVLQSADRQATFYVELARALADVPGRRDAEAVRALLTAERLAPQRVRAYTAARETARFLRSRAKREAGGSALRGLCERLGVGN
jgi:transcriptional regulator with XRE-family HTH domain